MEEYVKHFNEGVITLLVDVSGPYSKYLQVLGSCQPWVSQQPLRFQRCWIIKSCRGNIHIALLTISVAADYGEWLDIPVGTEPQDFRSWSLSLRVWASESFMRLQAGLRSLTLFVNFHNDWSSVFKYSRLQHHWSFRHSFDQYVIGIWQQMFQALIASSFVVFHCLFRRFFRLICSWMKLADRRVIWDRIMLGQDGWYWSGLQRTWPLPLRLLRHPPELFLRSRI
jgi:hypothetical protein